MPIKQLAHIFGASFKTLGSRIQRLIFLSVLLVPFSIFVESVYALALQHVLNFLGAPSQTNSWLPMLGTWSPSLSVIVGTLIALGIGRGLIIFAGAFTIDLAGNLFNFRLNQATFQGLLLKPADARVAPAEIQHRYSDIFPKAIWALQNLIPLFPALLISLGLLSIMFTFSPINSLVTVGTMVVIGASVYMVNSVTRRHTKKALSAQKQIHDAIQRVSKNWFLVKVHQTEAQEMGGLIGRNVYSTTEANAANVWGAIAALSPFVLGSILLALLVYLNVSGAIGEKGVFISFLYILVRLIQRIADAARMYGYVNANLPQLASALETIAVAQPAQISEYEKFVKVFSEARPPRKVKDTALAPRTQLHEAGLTLAPPEIKISGLGFGYGDQIILANAQASFCPGEITGLIGSSGSGKSTFVALMLSLLRPQSGHILYNGRPLHTCLEEGTINVGYVGPDSFLIEGTIRENLIYGLRTRVTDADILEAAKLAHFADVIHQQPLGLDTEVSDELHQLSSGQKQRMALTRAFLRKPNLLILDEASANLDHHSELEVSNAILSLRGTCTTVVISHRRKILEHASKIYQIRKGALTLADLSTLGEEQ